MTSSTLPAWLQRASRRARYGEMRADGDDDPVEEMTRRVRGWLLRHTSLAEQQIDRELEELLPSGRRERLKTLVSLHRMQLTLEEADEIERFTSMLDTT